MKEPNEIKATYSHIVSETRHKLDKVQKQIYQVGTIRLILFTAGVAGVIYFWSYGWMAVALMALVTFLPFLILIKKHNRMFYKKEYLEKKMEINIQEINALDYDISSFDDGSDFTDQEHLYTFDLDVFGEHSLFQLINRTSTKLGKIRLGDWFNTHLLERKCIEERQEAVRELKPELKFRQRFRVLGLLYRGEVADEQEIRDWAKSPGYYRKYAFLRALPTLVFLTNILLLVLAVLKISTFSIAGMAFVGFIFLSLIFSKGITRIQAMYGRKLQILGTYAGLIRLIEKIKVEAKELKEIKELVGNDKKTASQSVKRLSDLMNALDQRNNIMIAAILNGLFFWELRQMMRIEAWKEGCADELPRWLEAIGKMDALCSLATFAYNNPGYVYPQIDDKQFCMRAKALGHPLMNREKCVRNDIDMSKRPFFIIITGANMAGKSTYLRTVGINHLLACLGMPVFAKEMIICPTQLVTSLRTSDSLNDNESYFFAELKRLKLIIDMLASGKELFIILDEILKGTNSVDKQKGSFALISQFIALKTNGIIATHDLLLGTLADKYPENIKNYCFEAEIKNNELTFSYRLKEGVAQNMNACFLMKKMGIAVVE